MELLPEFSHHDPVVIDTRIGLNVRDSHGNAGWPETREGLYELPKRRALDVRISAPPRHERAHAGRRRNLQELASGWLHEELLNVA
jgi:hypothetical protein